ncbi:MAG: transcription initiation factor IIB family protein [Promethearchaeota archaeon]
MENYEDHLKLDSRSIEKCCDKPIYDVRNGVKVCLNCGMVFETYFVGEERRAFDKEEIEKKKQTELRWREFGSRTILSTDKCDSNGHSLNPEQKVLFSRLSKIQNSLVSSIERNFWEAKPKLKMFASKMNIPAYINESAWRIYANAAKKKLTMGRSIDGFLAASLYVAIRIHEFPKLLEDVSDAAMIPRKTVLHSIGILIKEVLPEMKLNYKPITIEQLIVKFSNELELPMEIQKKALDILKESSKKGLLIAGRDPKGIAASAIYLAFKKTKIKRTQLDVSKVAKITEVTLRTRVKDIESKLS